MSAYTAASIQQTPSAEDAAQALATMATASIAESGHFEAETEITPTSLKVNCQGACVTTASQARKGDRAVTAGNAHSSHAQYLRSLMMPEHFQAYLPTPEYEPVALKRLNNSITITTAGNQDLMFVIGNHYAQPRINVWSRVVTPSANCQVGEFLPVNGGTYYPEQDIALNYNKARFVSGLVRITSMMSYGGDQPISGMWTPVEMATLPSLRYASPTRAQTLSAFANRDGPYDFLDGIVAISAPRIEPLQDVFPRIYQINGEEGQTLTGPAWPQSDGAQSPYGIDHTTDARSIVLYPPGGAVTNAMWPLLAVAPTGDVKVFVFRPENTLLGSQVPNVTGHLSLSGVLRFAMTHAAGARPQLKLQARVRMASCSMAGVATESEYVETVYREQEDTSGATALEHLRTVNLDYAFFVPEDRTLLSVTIEATGLIGGTSNVTSFGLAQGGNRITVTAYNAKEFNGAQNLVFLSGTQDKLPLHIEQCANLEVVPNAQTLAEVKIANYTPSNIFEADMVKAFFSDRKRSGARLFYTSREYESLLRAGRMYEQSSPENLIATTAGIFGTAYNVLKTFKPAFKAMVPRASRGFTRMINRPDLEMDLTALGEKAFTQGKMAISAGSGPESRAGAVVSKQQRKLAKRLLAAQSRAEHARAAVQEYLKPGIMAVTASKPAARRLRELKNQELFETLNAAELSATLDRLNHAKTLERRVTPGAKALTSGRSGAMYGLSSLFDEPDEGDDLVFEGNDPVRDDLDDPDEPEDSDSDLQATEAGTRLGNSMGLSLDDEIAAELGAAKTGPIPLADPKVVSLPELKPGEVDRNARAVLRMIQKGVHPLFYKGAAKQYGNFSVTNSFPGIVDGEGHVMTYSVSSGPRGDATYRKTTVSRESASSPTTIVQDVYMNDMVISNAKSVAKVIKNVGSNVLTYFDSKPMYITAVGDHPNITSYGEDSHSLALAACLMGVPVEALLTGIVMPAAVPGGPALVVKSELLAKKIKLAIAKQMKIVTGEVVSSHANPTDAVRARRIDPSRNMMCVSDVFDLFTVIGYVNGDVPTEENIRRSVAAPKVGGVQTDPNELPTLPLKPTKIEFPATTAVPALKGKTSVIIKNEADVTNLIEQIKANTPGTEYKQDPTHAISRVTVNSLGEEITKDYPTDKKMRVAAAYKTTVKPKFIASVALFIEALNKTVAKNSRKGQTQQKKKATPAPWAEDQELDFDD